MKKILSVLIAAVMLIGCIPFAQAMEAEDYNPIGQSLATTVSPYLEEGGFESEDYFLTIDDFAAHTITFINIWSNGCGPCISEMPHFQRIHEEYGDRGVLVVGGVTTWISGNFAQEYEYLQSHGYTYMNVIPDDVLRTLYYHNQYVPQTFIVDSEGTVIDFIGGSTTYANLVQKIEYWMAILDGDHEDHTVTFVDGVTNEVIETQTVAHAHAPVYPEAPVHEGYTFNAWDPANVTMVLEDMTITATYTPKTYRVRFYDSIDNSLISQQFIVYGNPAVEPEAPVHPGYNFVGWDTDFSVITGATDIHTIYEPSGELMPGDVNGDGEVNGNDALAILRHSLGIVTLPESALAVADVNGDGEVNGNDALYVLRMSLGLI